MTRARKSVRLREDSLATRVGWSTLPMRLSLGAALVAGCAPELGPCDEDAARVLVYQSSESPVFDGLPMYAGQALVDRSCGGGAFCHAPAATNRFGASPLMNFDVRLACNNLDDPSRCDLTRLAEAHDDVNRYARRILLEVERGTMPPGAAGERVVGVSRHYRLGPEMDAPALPSIESSEGRSLLKQWLACEAPVVARTVAERSDLPAGSECVEETEGAGECRVRVGDGIGVPEPQWSSIYAQVLVPACTGCHGGLEDVLQSSNLDLSGGPTLAHQALFRIRAMGDGELHASSGTCADSGLLRVDTQDPAGSLLVQKLRGSPECGEAMPIGFSLSTEVVDVVEQWIACGATREESECP